MNDYTILLHESPMTYSNLIYSLLDKDTGFSFRRRKRERQFPVLSFPRTIYLSSCCRFLQGEGSCCSEMGSAWVCTQHHVSSLCWSSPSLQGRASNQGPSHNNDTGGLCGFSPSLLCMYSLCLYACMYVSVCGSQRFHQVSLKQCLTEP